MAFRPPAFIAAVLTLLPLACGQEPPARDQDAKPEPIQFTRWVPAGETEGRFETAIVGYKDGKGRRVDLIGAVHIGDSEYYRKLQKMFEAYDAVLYELVAPKGTRPDPDEKSDSLISLLQRGMKNVLDLDFQLDAIDYSKENLVHADLDPERFRSKQKEKGESIVKLMLRSMMIGLKREQEGKGSKLSPIHLIAAFMSKDRGRYLKFLFAQELENMEEMLAAFGGDKASASVIIGDRNKEAMRVLDEQLKAGRTKLGLFYGAGHLPDMEDRLLARGFRRGEVSWVTAWDCMMSDEMRAAAEAKKKKEARKQ